MPPAYYGVLSVALLVACIYCWMLGSWMRFFSIIATAGSSYAGYAATFPDYGQRDALLVAGIVAFVCLLFTSLAATFRRHRTILHKCPNCGETMPRQPGGEPLCPKCGGQLRTVAIPGRKCPKCLGTEFGYEYVYAEHETDPPIAYCKRCQIAITQ